MKININFGDLLTLVNEGKQSIIGTVRASALTIDAEISKQNATLQIKGGNAPTHQLKEVRPRWKTRYNYVVA